MCSRTLWLMSMSRPPPLLADLTKPPRLALRTGWLSSFWTLLTNAFHERFSSFSDLSRRSLRRWGSGVPLPPPSSSLVLLLLPPSCLVSLLEAPRSLLLPRRGCAGSETAVWPLLLRIDESPPSSSQLSLFFVGFRFRPRREFSVVLSMSCSFLRRTFLTLFPSPSTLHRTPSISLTFLGSFFLWLLPLRHWPPLSLLLLLLPRPPGSDRDVPRLPLLEDNFWSRYSLIGADRGSDFLERPVFSGSPKVWSQLRLKLWLKLCSIILLIPALLAGLGDGTMWCCFPLVDHDKRSSSPADRIFRTEERCGPEGCCCCCCCCCCCGCDEDGSW
mmetsp:Transcript_22817/g.48517  ORF Transcript_22817/g.48517 Transcript_22817/m.48517 type:complete len:330 (-) Transcript_22817:625-1614(-)